MGTILITGVSGLIGGALAKSLSTDYDVIGMSRRDPSVDIPFIKGDFGSFEDLRLLDGFDIDTVVHLAAVTGGCSERDGLLVNAEGTRCLMRYLIDRGCRKFVMASSIAVAGIQNKAFRPVELPIPDEHPCLDRDGYGFSKFMMEEIMKYHVRQTPDLDVIALRLSVVVPETQLPPPVEVGPLTEWALGAMTVVPLEEALRMFNAAVRSPFKAGMRIMNAVSSKAWATDPVADILKHWYGRDVDVSHYEQPGHEGDGVYACRRMNDELGIQIDYGPDVLKNDISRTDC
jgi:nucleoside-diphosphate-sugar epimerase